MFNLDTYEYFEDINLGLVKYMPKHKKVLDVGCGHGLLGETYRKNQNYVVGIDLSEVVDGAGTKRMDEFHRADITDFGKVTTILGDQRFDVIIFADVLEHVYDPVSVVNFYKQFLTQDGKLYVSVPNFVVWYSRLQILLGDYKYTDVGTQDKTHIRIFTKNNLKRMAQATSLNIKRMDITPGIARFFVNYVRKFFKSTQSHDRGSIMKSPAYQFYIKYLYRLEYLFCKLWPGMLSFQYIVIFEKN